MEQQPGRRDADPAPPPQKKKQRSLLSWVSKTTAATTTTTAAAAARAPPRASASAPAPASSSSRRNFIDGPPGLLSLDAESHVLYLPGLLKEEEKEANEGDTTPKTLFQRLRGEVEWLQRDVTVFNRTTPQRRLVAYQSCHEDRLPPYTYSGLTLEPRRATPAVAEVLSRVERAAAERCAVFPAPPRPRPSAASSPAPSSPPCSDGNDAPPPPRLFNSCLLNLYRGGGDCMGWHADDEAIYSPAPPPALARGGGEIAIASASFGERRDFYLRPKPAAAVKNGSRSGGAAAAAGGGARAAAPEAAAARRGDARQPRVRYSLGEGDVLFMLGQTQRRFQHSVPARANSNGERINLTFRWNVQVGGEAPRVGVSTIFSN
jgi:alkylated DNA repair dioxygenase AlkB